MDRLKALVTGASRGIGRAIALDLARAGYDVAISARTRIAGERHEHGLSIHRTDDRPLPGSLEETARDIEALGREALIVPADLLDRASVEQCIARIRDAWGGLDAIVHNGRHLGPGMMDRFMDIPLDAYGKFFEAHCVAPILITRAFLPAMVERRRGDIVNITSLCAYRSPSAAPGEGGWGLGYSVGKSAGHPLVGALHAEFAGQGIRAFNVQPGSVATERSEMVTREYGRSLDGAAPPAVIGAVVAWLLTDPAGGALAGTCIEAQDLARERGLYPGWG